jgi:hypothetical protein
VTHELFLDIESTSVKCVPTILQSVGCKQCEDDVGGAVLQLVGVCGGAPRAALSCVVEEGLMSASFVAQSLVGSVQQSHVRKTC